MPFEAPRPRGLALYPHHGRNAAIGRVALVPRREVIQDEGLGADLLGESGGHDGRAVAVLDGVGLHAGVRLTLDGREEPRSGRAGGRR